MEHIANPLLLPGLLQYSEDMDTEPCVVYLMSSGKEDDVYKIGMTSNITRRLSQVRLKWDVPKAEVLATITLTGRARALGVEHMLHWDWNHCRAYDYAGIEFFRLDNKDLSLVLTFFGSPPSPVGDVPEPKVLPSVPVDISPPPPAPVAEPEFVLEKSKGFRMFFSRLFGQT